MACHPVVGEALDEPVGAAILSPQPSSQPVAPKGLRFAKLLAGPTSEIARRLDELTGPLLAKIKTNSTNPAPSPPGATHCCQSG